MYLVVLGIHPKLSLAELISLYKNAHFHSTETAIVKSNDVDFERLGGSIKLGQIISSINKTDLSSIHAATLDVLAPYLGKKRDLGISFYGTNITNYQQFCWQIRKDIKSQNKNVRIVLAKKQQLSSAQVKHNHLTHKGIEVLISIGTADTHIAITESIQDITRYSQRDYERPCRDPRMGMLPPKLAQIMINLANPKPNSTVLDPFCGTGVVLQEALLMGFSANGSDINPRMVSFTEKNLSWLWQYFDLDTESHVVLADATKDRFLTPIDAIVTESDLGPSLTSPPDAGLLSKLQTANLNLVLSFLQNLTPQLKPRTPVCLTIPAWKIADNKYSTAPVIDRIPALGYNYKSFADLNLSDLIYARSDQIVARQILALEKT